MQCLIKLVGHVTNNGVALLQGRLTILYALLTRTTKNKVGLFEIIEELDTSILSNVHSQTSLSFTCLNSFSPYSITNFSVGGATDDLPGRPL